MKKRGCNQRFQTRRSRKRKIISKESTDSSSEKIIHTYGVDLYLQSVEPEDQSMLNMDDSIKAVESILRYEFNDKSLLEEALTHSSCTGLSYERLEFLGDSVLALAISNFFFLTYRNVDAGKLSQLRAVNVSNEKLARVAAKHKLHMYIRHNNATVLNDKVWEFLNQIEKSEKMDVYGGQLKAPKVLADVVESVAAAVFMDCGMNLHETWRIFGHLLEPLVMLDVILAEPQPITALYESCQKEGKQVDIQYQRNGDRTVASVFVGGTYIASCSSETKENAKLHAAEAALLKITKSESGETSPRIDVDSSESTGSEGAKQRLHDLCNKKRWPNPTYRTEQDLGPSHDKRYVCSVEVELSDTSFTVKGNERTRVKDAQNSAASRMFCTLQEAGYA